MSDSVDINLNIQQENIDVNLSVQNENVDISLSVQQEVVDIVSTPSVTTVNVTSSASINPSLYDLSQFTNVTSNKFIRESNLSSYVPANRTITINGVTLSLSSNRSWDVGTVTSIGLEVPTGFTASSPITTSGEITIGFASGYSLPSDNSQANWESAYNNMIVSGAVTGTTTKTLTLTQQDGGTVVASWSDFDTAPVTSVFGRLGDIIAEAGDYSTTLVTEGTNLYFTDSRARASLSSSATGLTYNTTTGVFSLTSGYSIPTTSNQSNWTTAYNRSIVSAAVNYGAFVTNLVLTQENTNTITASLIGGTPIQGKFVFFNGSNLAYTSLNASAPLSLDSNNFTFSISQAGTSTDGYLSTTDWNTFNNKQNAITLTTTGTSGNATFVGDILNIPNYGAALTDYVPYTGANQTVNLNTQQLLAGHATFTTNGSTDTLTINHTSGSGNAIIVTKAGSGEGLIVTKTSGSGNAASITGGVTLLSELHLTTDLADAYIASSANWNTAYNNRITSLTTTGSSGPATLVSHVLNIPNYTLSGLGGVPLSRRITINGTIYDLSDDRSWSVGTVTSIGISVPTGLTVSNTPITTNGVIAIGLNSDYSIPTITKQDNWSTAYSWGDHSLEGYLTVETDPIFSSSPSFGITNTDITNWNTAYSWGNHATQNYATTTYVDTAVNNLIDSAPGTLDTLNELAAALGDDPNFATTVATSIGTKVPLTRTLTINGTAYDLSADRSWTILDSYIQSVQLDGTLLRFGGVNSAFHGNIDLSALGYLTSFTETDPTVPAHVKSITTTEKSNWNTAYSWGNHAGLYSLLGHTHTFASITSKPTTIAGFDITDAYTDVEIRNFFSGTDSITGYNKSNWDTAYSWGNHASVGYLTSFTETDPTVPSHVKGITTADILNWNTAFSWGDHGAEGYATQTWVQAQGYLTSETDSQILSWSASDLGLAISNGNTITLTGLATETYVNSQGFLTSFTETDPTVPSHVKGITTTNISNWNTAFGWGNHASVGYLTSFTETDPTVPSHVKAITTTNISNWNTAYSWGDHSTRGYATETYVNTAVSNLIDSAPGTLDTLNELAAALGDDPNFATTVATSIGTKQNQLSGTGFVKVIGTTVSYDNSTYLTTANAASTYVALGGAYSNPSWITSLAWSKITGAPAFLTSYTETDPIYTASSWYSTTNNSTNWNTAYGWGDHNTRGYATQSWVQSQGYLTSETDSQTLSWSASDKSLSISNGNSVTLTGLATESFVTGQGYITSYTETDTLNSVTGRGATTSNTIQVGKLGIGRAAASNESISVENPEGRWLIQGFRSGVSVGGLHTNDGILHVQANNVRIQASSNATWNGDTLATRPWVTSQGYIVTGSTVAETASWTGATKFRSSGDISNSGASNHALQVFADLNNDAFMAFHISGDYAVYFGVENATNRLYTGGWSEGANKYQIWDSRDFTSTNISNWNTAYGWGDHSTRDYATTTYVNTQISNLISGAPGALDTLDELAAALGDDANFASTVTNSIATKLPLAGGTMTGKIYAPSFGSDAYGGAFEIRERGFVGSVQSAWSYSPAISFHWGNRHIKRFGLRADGLFAIDDEPIALRSWVTSQGYLTSYTETDTLATVTGRGNTTSNNVRFGSFVDLGSFGSAFRFYDGSTFRGGLGLDDWAHYGSASNITMYVDGDNSFFISTSGVKRAQFNSGAAIFRTYSADTAYNIRMTGGDQFNAYYNDSAATLYLQYHNGNGGTLNVGNGKLTVNTAGSVVASGDMRAPIFYDINNTDYYLDPSADSTGISLKGKGSILLGPNSSGRYTRLGGNGGSTDEATISASNGNLHIDCKDAFGLYLNYYSRNTIYLGQSGAITSDGAYYNGTSAYANSSGNADTLDSYHETAFVRLSPNSSTTTNGMFAIGTDGSRNFIQSHAGRPLDINPLGNTVTVGSDMTVSGNVTASKLGVGGSINTSFDLYNNGTSYFNGRTYFDDQIDISSSYSLNFGTSRLHSTDTSYFLGGNVGIGTATPDGKLEISSNTSVSSYITQYTNDADGAELVIRTARGTESSPVRYNTNDSAGRILFQAYTSAGEFEDAASIESVLESGYANSYAGLRFNYVPAVSPYTLTEGMRLNMLGNVGIGTTSPSVRLHVFSSGIVQRLESSSSYTQLDFYNTTNTAANRNWAIGTNLYSYGDFNIMASAAYNTAPNASYTYLTIKNSGNIGIGTTSPSYKLDVVGDLYVNGTNGAFTTDNSQSNLYFLNLTRSTESLVTAGNVGIGTTNPDRGLTISRSNQYASLNIYKANTTNQIVYLGTGSSGADDDTILQLFDEATEKVRIFTAGSSWFNGGNVGIGTTTPQVSLDVNGGAYFRSDIRLGPDFTGASTAIFKWQGSSSDSLGIFTWGDSKNIQIGGNNVIFAAEGGATRMLLESSGNLRIAGTFTEQSARRFKENIKPLESSLDKVNNLNPVTYNKIGSEDLEIGLIAEEVAELFPEVVTYTEDGETLGIQYQRLSVILLKAVQDLTARIEKLENK